VQRFVQEFDRSPDWTLVDDGDIDLLRTEQKRPDLIFNLRDLDTPLKPRFPPPPVFPASAPDEAKSGEALIEFLVDEEGRARLLPARSRRRTKRLPTRPCKASRVGVSNPRNAVGATSLCACVFP